MSELTEKQIEAGAKALYGDGWETHATTGGKSYCREKAKLIWQVMFAAQESENLSMWRPGDPVWPPFER